MTLKLTSFHLFVLSKYCHNQLWRIWQPFSFWPNSVKFSKMRIFVLLCSRLYLLPINNLIRYLRMISNIEPLESPWISPVVVLTWKKDNTYRLCVDCRRLNKVSQSDMYLFSNISSIFKTIPRKWRSGVRNKFFWRTIF